MFVSFDETDTQAHAGRYDRVLASTHKGDSFLRELWETLQAMPQYAGKTTLIVTTDHGRGNAPEEWKSHSASIPGAEYTWIAILGPDTRPLGVRENIEPVTSSQIAATAVQLLGYDYNTAVPAAGKPIADALP